MNYQDKLRDPRWQKMRLEILNRDNWQCTLCKDKDSNLQVHHEQYRGEPWDAPSDKLKTLCENCHHIISTFGGDNLLKVGKLKRITGDSYIFFFKHRIAVFMKYTNSKPKDIELIASITYDLLEKIKAEIPAGTSKLSF